MGYRYRAHQQPSTKDQYSTRYTRNAVSVDPEKARLIAALLEARYTRIDDDEKWSPVLYQQKDFSAVEKQVANLLRDRQDEGKAYDLYLLYENLANVEADKDIESKKGVLNEWCSENPKSHIPWLVRGAFYVDYAWHIRGGGWAKDVQKEAWQKFHALLEEARANLEESYRLNPSDPNSSCYLLIVARGLSYPREKMEEYFRNAISASLWHFGAHCHKLYYLMPKWHGTPKEMYDFTMQCLKFADEHPYMGLVAVVALNEIHDRSSEKENYLGRNDVWPIVERVYNNFFEKYPENIRRRFNYAYHAYKAKKYDVATKQFEIIGDRWIGNSPWKSLELFNNCRAYAYAAYGATLPPDQAVTYLRRSLELNPAEKASYFNLGTFAAKMGQYEEAKTAFLKATEFDPSDTEAHLRLSWIYGKINNPAEAKDHAEKALNCNPTEQQRLLAKCYIDSYNKTPPQK